MVALLVNVNEASIDLYQPPFPTRSDLRELLHRKLHYFSQRISG